MQTRVFILFFITSCGDNKDASLLTTQQEASEFIAVVDESPQLFIEHRDNWIDKFIEIRNNYDNN